MKCLFFSQIPYYNCDGLARGYSLPICSVFLPLAFMVCDMPWGKGIQENQFLILTCTCSCSSARPLVLVFLLITLPHSSAVVHGHMEGVINDPRGLLQLRSSIFSIRDVHFVCLSLSLVMKNYVCLINFNKTLTI